MYGHAAYAASKAGTLGQTKVPAFEWGPHGFTTNAISPAVVETELVEQVWSGPVSVELADSVLRLVLRAG
ncbi:SDR family oxidoreductase [Gluconacetobacter tumulisoli]|uniref:SDR family oxidoreductase n=1 Tax=Gluconacetobacter tumulisoli TaxID=1286189 RepID=UPI001FE3ACF1|nr:SDR family oxidoreductase [Gluconacetobacter tumulisoli]